MTDARLVRIMVRRGARHGHHALALDLMARAQGAGLAGATMLEIIEGFGAARRTHTAGRWSLSDAVAYEILIVDTEEQTRRFIEAVAGEIGDRGLVVTEAVQIVSGRIGPAGR